MEEMRLQKFLAHAGVASRRMAENYIKQGRVAVNNKIVTDMGVVVKNTDKITVDGNLVECKEEKIYIMLHKPTGYVSTARDQFGRQTVLDLVTDINCRLYPVGRLDYDTSGLIILSNDGDFTYRLTHPKHEIKKVYEALISGVPQKNEIKMFEKGLKIEDYITSPAKIHIKNVIGNNALVHITIHEGKNRQVRKMCEAIGHNVLTLKRISIGPIALGDLPEGKWRKLTASELKSLY
ncbi:rRNA pseudouridine synthase [Ruminiclostridium herbifermentans]|uniref:Pseudouridine synthase n=1 Tax=Ruminiclostridium herbifermentans TaxID=2488810 RepID=A0A4U7JIK4_9FIRM|nr:pseudouridine synthase [Ruminiclostridium herbifermentans]QNU65327.1 rRNA pseudouridine synthase [Ruminiclostridium herbifermentans]